MGHELEKTIKQAIEKYNQAKKEIAQQSQELEKMMLELTKEYGLPSNLEYIREWVAGLRIKPWSILHKKGSEYWVIVPKCSDFGVGWLDHSDKINNFFIINQYTQHFTPLPEEIRTEMNLPDPKNIFVQDETLFFDKEDYLEIKKKYGDNLSGISKDGTATIRKGKQIILTAQIVQDGFLPFPKKFVDPEDIREQTSKISFDDTIKDGRRISRQYQRDAWEGFKEYGSIGVFWMTGAGKDIFSTYILDRIKVPGRPNIYFAPSNTILEQMKERYFPKYCPRLSQELEAGNLWLVTYQGATQGKLFKKILRTKFGTAIFGECQHLPANTFSRMAMIDTKYRLGQSATPFREDHKEHLIFGLTGQPFGTDWKVIAKMLGKEYHDVNIYIVKNQSDKLPLIKKLIKEKEKTMIKVFSLEFGRKIADELNCPFIFGETKNRVEITEKNRLFVASEVLSMGISMKDLNTIIEPDVFGKSRGKALQTTGRIMHSEVGERHDTVITEEEFFKFGERFSAFIEKGFMPTIRNLGNDEKIALTDVFARKRRKKVVKSGLNPLKLIDEFYAEGYFRNGKDISELNSRIKKTMQRRGYAEITDSCTISTKLLRMTRRGLLRRDRVDGTYKYFEREKR